MNEKANKEYDGDFVADETFRLLLGSFVWQNEHLFSRNEACNKILKQKRKNVFLLFVINYTENCTLSRLEEILFENRSTISVAVTKMQEEGLIKKAMPKKGDDGRKVYFKVTSKGKAAMEEYKQLFSEEVKNFYESISTSARIDFINGIMSLNKVFDPNGEERK